MECVINLLKQVYTNSKIWKTSYASSRHEENEFATWWRIVETHLHGQQETWRRQQSKVGVAPALRVRLSQSADAEPCWQSAKRKGAAAARGQDHFERHRCQLFCQEPPNHSLVWTVTEPVQLEVQQRKATVSYSFYKRAKNSKKVRLIKCSASILNYVAAVDECLAHAGAAVTMRYPFKREFKQEPTCDFSIGAPYQAPIKDYNRAEAASKFPISKSAAATSTKPAGVVLRANSTQLKPVCFINFEQIYQEQQKARAPQTRRCSTVTASEVP